MFVTGKAFDLNLLLSSNKVSLLVRDYEVQTEKEGFYSYWLSLVAQRC